MGKRSFYKYDYFSAEFSLLILIWSGNTSEYIYYHYHNYPDARGNESGKYYFGAGSGELKIAPHPMFGLPAILVSLPGYRFCPVFTVRSWSGKVQKWYHFFKSRMYFPFLSSAGNASDLSKRR